MRVLLSSMPPFLLNVALLFPLSAPGKSSSSTVTLLMEFKDPKPPPCTALLPSGEVQCFLGKALGTSKRTTLWASQGGTPVPPSRSREGTDTSATIAPHLQPVPHPPSPQAQGEALPDSPLMLEMNPAEQAAITIHPTGSKQGKR